MKFALVFYSAYDGDKRTEGEDGKQGERVLVDADAVAAYAKRVNVGGDMSLFMREAEMFNGQPEVHGDQLPKVVVLLGDGKAMDAVREVYESLEVEVSTGDLEDEKLPEAATSPSDDDDPFDGDIVALKAKATDLGISFAPTIGYNNLLTRYQGLLKQKEESGQQTA